MADDTGLTEMVPAEPPVALPAIATPLTIAAPVAIDTVDDRRLDEALGAMQDAEALTLAGRFAEAASRSEWSAGHLFPLLEETPSSELQFLFDYAKMLGSAYRAIALMQLGAVTDALQPAQKAIAAGEDDVLPGLEGADFAPAFKQQISSIIKNVGLILQSIELANDMRTENFRAAQDRAEAAIATATEAIAMIKALDLAPKQSRMQVASLQMTIAALAAQGTFARAEADRQRQDWDAALAGYDKVVDMIREAGKQAARIDAPIATDFQVQLLNTTLIPAARLRLKENQALVEQGQQRLAVAAQEAATLKSALAAFQSWSPTFKTAVDVDVNVSTKLMLNVGTVAHDRLVDDLGALRQAASALPPAERDELTARIDALRGAGTAKDEGLFKKVAEFVKNSGELLEGLGKAAEPVGKVVAWVAPLLGTPLLAALGFGGFALS